MKFKFQSFYDVSTSASSMQVLQFSVGGKEVLDRCRHLFGAYKYFKLGKLSIKMCPASTLPVDPLQLSYDTSDPQSVDPRDQMNPGLVRITNGEDIYTNVSALSEGQQQQVYNAMMLDPRWSKFMLQSGFRRTAVPLYWQIGQLSQDKFPGATVNVPNVRSSLDGQTVNVQGVDSLYKHTESTVASGSPHTSAEFVKVDNSSVHGLFQVGHRGRLGFLPTDYMQDVIVKSDGTISVMGGANNVPEISVITCVLPKAYKTIYYYRVFVTEEVIFSGLRSAPMPDSVTGATVVGLDQFLYGNTVASGPWGSMTRPAVIQRMNNGDGKP